jgi:hypothetical protein
LDVAAVSRAPSPVDEAHMMKNADTASCTTVTWLKAQFIVMAIATVLSNRIEDFADYMKSVEPSGNLWTEDNLAKWNITLKTNPFLLQTAILL